MVCPRSFVLCTPSECVLPLPPVLFAERTRSPGAAIKSSRKNGNSLMRRPRKEHLGSLFGRARAHGQVLTSLKSAEASWEVRVAISLGG